MFNALITLINKETGDNLPPHRSKYKTYARGLDTEAQGGIYISLNSNKFIENDTSEVDFDKIKGYNDPERGKFK